VTDPRNDTLIRALLREPVSFTPVWIMRQAGRYLPEYRAVRARTGEFMTLCQTPERACEVTLQPLARFDLDAAILFSDILTIPDAMGLGLYFEPGEGPRFRKTVSSQADVDALIQPDMDDELSYIPQAVRMITQELGGKVPLIGFAGSPWTIATYMVEGGSSRDFRRTKAMMYSQPEVLHQLLSRLADAVTTCLAAQIDAGARVVQIFDTWGGILPGPEYRTFSLDYMQKILDNLAAHTTHKVPVILFTKNGGQWLETMAGTGAQALGLDWTTDLAQARQRVGDRVALQGNLDPAVLYASPDVIRQHVARILDAWGGGTGHVFNLGHGIHPQIDPDRVRILVDTVHELSSV